MSASTTNTSTPLFDRRAFALFSLPRRIGAAISAWDDPPTARGRDVTHMRPDDYVIGVLVAGRARAYPLWIVDYYHVINDSVDGRRIVVTSCERCQSGGAFLPDVPGNPSRPALFRAVGFMNGTLVLKDLRIGSHWNHYDGRGLTRAAVGVRLPLLPTFHTEWADWLALHPDSDVLVPPENPTHPDARHGHGREEMFERPGMDPDFVPTILGPLDERYPEQRMVLGVDLDGIEAAFPLHEVQRHGGVVHHELGERTVVVFAGPRPDGFTMACFDTVVNGRALTFVREQGGFADAETGSWWSVEGAAMDGPLAGTNLVWLPSSYVRWHAWVYCHRGTKLFRSDRTIPVWPDVPKGVDVEPVTAAALGELRRLGHAVLVEGPVVSQLRPREASSSLSVVIDGHPVRVHAFPDHDGAADHVALRGAWSTWPYRTFTGAGRLRRLGRVVLQSEPEVRFADPANVVPIPDAEVAWAPVLEDPRIGVDGEDTTGGAAPPSGVARAGPSFRTILEALRRRYDVLDLAFLPPGQLRVGCENAVALTIEADRFLLYRFVSEEDAAAYASSQGHTVRAGRFVLRSTPEAMYQHTRAEILFIGDDRVPWSPLLLDGSFVSHFERACAG